MAALGLNVANDIANAILKWYARGKAISQTMYERPLVKFLHSGKKTFGGGNQYISDPVQGAYMADGQAILGGGNFFQGYSEDDQLAFAQTANLLRAEYKWYEVHAGLVITWTELKKDGISITDGGKKNQHSDEALSRLTSLLENRMDDYGESWARCINRMYWQDGLQDAKQMPGIRSILTDTPAVGVTGGLNRAAYPWWQHYAFLGIQPSEADQTLAKTLRSKQRVLRQRMGKPNKFLCGSAFLDALEIELQAKGYYTQTGFATKETDIAIDGVALRGVGTFEYDPSMDIDMALSKYCFEFDSRRIKLRPMEGEENKVITPERPYQYMVFLKSMTWTGALQATQLNCHGVFSIA